MARLGPEGIDVIASPDGAWLAVTQPDRLALHKAATFECVATFPLPLPGPTDLGFVTGPLRLLAFTRGDGITVGQGLTLPGLEPCGRREIQGLWQARHCIAAHQRRDTALDSSGSFEVTMVCGLKPSASATINSKCDPCFEM